MLKPKVISEVAVLIHDIMVFSYESRDTLECELGSTIACATDRCRSP